ncbi:MAG: acyltransferase [Clostridia bacterium]|nr:acyltransferase [Clostridia bacterium]
MSENNLNSRRQYFDGIDILKILAMFLVTMLHIVVQGVKVDSCTNEITKGAMCFLESVGFNCIDVFVLCTGFLCYGKKGRFSRIIQLWLQVAFWSLTCNLIIYKLLGKNIEHENIIIALNTFAITYKPYWYFTAYVALFIFIPLLNSAIDNISAKTYALSLGIGTVLFCMLPFVYRKNLFDLSEGYSFAWLTFVYLIGAEIRKYDLIGKIKSKLLILMLTVSLAVTTILAYLHTTKVLVSRVLNFDILYRSYNSIFILTASVSLFLLLAQVQISNSFAKKVLRICASASFSVYLIQCSQGFWENYLSGHYEYIASFHVVKAVIYVLLISILMFTTMLILGIMQDKLFGICKVNKLCKKVESSADRIFNALYIKLLTRLSKINS